MRYEILRVLKGRWFLISILGTALFLWTGIGSESYFVLNDSEHMFNVSVILRRALVSESSMLSLPALAALPAAASALLELRCGAARNAVFRAGRKSYLFGKLLSLLVSALLAQLAGIVLFTLILFSAGGAFAASDVSALWEPIAARLAVSGAYACMGAIFALASGTSAAAYVAPMAVCYALIMISARFLIDVPYINPTDWLIGDSAFLVSSILCAVCAVMFLLVLKREMRKFA